MAETYPNYVNGQPTGHGTGVASICGLGVEQAGQSLGTITAAGVIRNIIDDGAGNASFMTLSSSNPTVSQPALSSGVAAQNLTGSDATYMIQINAGAAGSYTVAIGPLNTTTTVVANAASLAIGNNILLSIPVPKNWWIKVTVTTVTIGTVTLVNI